MTDPLMTSYGGASSSYLSAGDFEPVATATQSGASGGSMAMTVRELLPTPRWLADPMLEQELRALRENIDRQLAAFAELPDDWDSYGGRPLDATVRWSVTGFLVDVARSGYPAPYVAPTPAGGISMEWHRSARELTVEFRPVAGASAYFYDPDAGVEWEQDLPGTRRLLPALTLMEG